MRHNAGLAAVMTAFGLSGAAGAAAQAPVIDTPAAARIAYEADGAIHTIAADGSGRVRLTPPATDLRHDSDPAWSPAGDVIAFTRTGPDGDTTRVWLVRPDGSGARPLIPNQPRGREDRSPAWSPDGSQVAFVRYRFGRSRLTVSIVASSADGASQRTVYSASVSYDEDEDAKIPVLYQLAWSPDGQQILLTRITETADGEDLEPPSLHLVPASGGEPRRLAPGAADGTWSPDGARIAFTHMRSAFDTGDIAVMNADGSGRTALMNTRADDVEPSWAGDGQRIVFESDRNTSTEFNDDPLPELYSIRPDGSCMTWLTNGTAESGSPSFDPRPGLSSDPGACGPTDRQPLVETDTRAAERFDDFQLLWLGPVAEPSRRLLTDVEVTGDTSFFFYDDCGRWEPRECGAFLAVSNEDMCTAPGILRDVGGRNSTLSIARGALVHVVTYRDFTSVSVHSHRTLVEIHAPRGSDPQRLLDALSRVGQPHTPGSTFPQARLPRRVWRTLTRVTAAYARLKDVDAVAERLHLARREVKRRIALARRLAELGVKRRLGC